MIQVLIWTKLNLLDWDSQNFFKICSTYTFRNERFIHLNMETTSRLPKWYLSRLHPRSTHQIRFHDDLWLRYAFCLPVELGLAWTVDSAVWLILYVKCDLVSVLSFFVYQQSTSHQLQRILRAADDGTFSKHHTHVKQSPGCANRMAVSHSFGPQGWL